MKVPSIIIFVIWLLPRKLYLNFFLKCQSIKNNTIFIGLRVVGALFGVPILYSKKYGHFGSSIYDAKNLSKFQIQMLKDLIITNIEKRITQWIGCNR